MIVRGWLIAGVALLVALPSLAVETKKKKPAATTEAKKPKSAATSEPEKPKPEVSSEPTKPKPEVVESAKPERAPAASIEPGELAEFSAQPSRVQQLITSALALTKLNLTYTFGSADPAKGGMDCSGTIFCVLKDQGLADVPRDSSGQYEWVRKGRNFFTVVSQEADGFEFSDLLPGDLLFWTGTYETKRAIPISHVMLYLGREKKSGKRVMFGASDGRSYAGVQRWGVSVFDFKMPKADPARPERRVDFIGYGRIPGLREKGEPTLPVLDESAPPRKKNAVKKAR